jgi:anti-sigma-K factor RskA
MDVKAYISSGILEAFALGAVSDQEQREVACLRKIYPEIEEALRTIEGDAESFASAYAIKPPSDLKARIMADVRNTRQEAPLQAVKPAPAETAQKTPETLVVPISRASSPALKWAAAAAILGVAFGLWQFSQQRSTASELAALKTEQTENGKKINLMEKQIAELHQGMDELYAPGNKKIVMAAVAENSPLEVAVFWNKDRGQVQIDPSTLPDLPTDRQYQLWVLVDGQPSDMGVLPKDASEILTMEYASLQGDAFAITIEPLGGNPTPTLENLVVLGKVA